MGAVVCPVCQSKKIQTIASNSTISFYACDDCGVRFTVTPKSTSKTKK